jgi:hypothetical protein
MVGTARLHSHHAIQLLVAAEPFTLADGDGTRRMARGQNPDPRRHPLRSILRYTAASGLDALRR